MGNDPTVEDVSQVVVERGERPLMEERWMYDEVCILVCVCGGGGGVVQNAYHKVAIFHSLLPHLKYKHNMHC